MAMTVGGFLAAGRDAGEALQAFSKRETKEEEPARRVRTKSFRDEGPSGDRVAITVANGTSSTTLAHWVHGRRETEGEPSPPISGRILRTHNTSASSAVARAVLPPLSSPPKAVHTYTPSGMPVQDMDALKEIAAAVTSEDAIETIYIPHFKVCLQWTYWVTAKRVLEAIRDLEYHGLKAEAFYKEIDDLIQAMPAIGPRVDLIIFLKRVRRDDNLLVYKDVRRRRVSGTVEEED